MPEQLGVGTMVLADAHVSVTVSTADRKSTEAGSHNMCSAHSVLKGMPNKRVQHAVLCVG